MRAKRTDSNHQAVRDGLRARSYEVLDLSGAGCGVPDLCVKLRDGSPLFLEVKDGSLPPSARGLTGAELKWRAWCESITRVVLTLEDALLQLEAANE